MSGELENKIALVTGGGGGIGSAICVRLAAAGATVVITYREREEQARAVFETLAGQGHMIAQAAVTDSAAMTALATSIETRYGGLDILVNNAGITRPVPHADLDNLDDATIDAIFQTNWRGAFATVRACRRLLAAGSGGVVINLSSIAARTGVGSNVAYCASKAALDSLTVTLARALAPAIRVISVSPGWVFGEYAKRADPAYLQSQTALTPLGRLATADDVANAVFAAVTGLTFTTGAIIPVDGGRPLN